MKIRYFLKLDIEKSEISLNFNYNIIFKNRIYLRKQVLNLKIKKIIFIISIERVNNKIININNNITITIYMKNIIDNVIKIHVINNFKINIFININTITL